MPILRSALLHPANDCNAAMQCYSCCSFSACDGSVSVATGDGRASICCGTCAVTTLRTCFHVLGTTIASATHAPKSCVVGRNKGWRNSLRQTQRAVRRECRGLPTGTSSFANAQHMTGKQAKQVHHNLNRMSEFEGEKNKPF